MLFLDLFGLLFLIVKMVFLPLPWFIGQKISCCPARKGTKSIRSIQTGEVNNIRVNDGFSQIYRSNVLRRKNIEETLT